jgi:hypothetical protein
MQTRKLWYGAALLVALCAGGCTTSGNVATGQDLAVTLDVQNNLPGLVGITAFIVTETGSRRSLGPVNSNQRQAFERTLRAGTYYLVASRVGASEIQSERFRLDTSPIAVSWNVMANQLSFSR